MLTAQNFYSVLKRFSDGLPHWGHAPHFMHDEKKRRRQHRDYRPFFTTTIHYRRRWIAVEIFCDPNGDGKGKVFLRVLPSKTAASTNTQHVTLTNKNISDDGVYHVSPRLDKCGGRLKITPRKIGCYPERAKWKVRKFLVGPMGKQLLPRLFEVAIAKYDSI